MIRDSTRIRTAVLALSLAIPPTSAALAQHHAHHKGGAAAPPASKPAPAAKPAAKPVSQPRAMNKITPTHASQPRLSDASIVSSLHPPRSQLAQAGQDSNGHRDRALHAVEEALRLLGNRSGTAALGAGRSASTTGASRTSGSTTSNPLATTIGTGSTTGSATASNSSQPPTQATSDSQLLSARQALRNLESGMDISGMNSHNYIKAKDAVQSALRELNLALVDR